MLSSGAWGLTDPFAARRGMGAASVRQRHDARPQELAVASQERHPVGEARRRDDLIGGIASEVEALEGPDDVPASIDQGADQRPAYVRVCVKREAAGHSVLVA